MTAPPPRAKSREMENQAFLLMKKGIDFDSIAAQVGYANRGTAWRACQRVLNREIAPEVKEYRALELARLDDLQKAIWDAATTKGPKQMPAIDRIVKIMAERRRYVPGLEAPEKVEHTGADGGPILNMIMPPLDPDTTPIDQADLAVEK